MKPVYELQIGLRDGGSWSIYGEKGELQKMITEYKDTSEGVWYTFEGHTKFADMRSSSLDIKGGDVSWFGLEHFGD